MMAMGVSTHPSPFSPSRPSLFSLSRSSYPAKTLHRRGLHMTQRPLRTFSNINAYRSFFHLKYSSHSHVGLETRPFYSGELAVYVGKENASSKARMLVRRAYPDSFAGRHSSDGTWASPFYSGELALYVGEENASSKARMLVRRAYPDSFAGRHSSDGTWASPFYSGELALYVGEENASSKARMLVRRAYPDSSARKHTSDGTWARAEQENGQAYKPLNLPPGHKAGYISGMKSSASGPTPMTSPLGRQAISNRGSVKSWAQERIAMEKFKREVFISIGRKTSEEDMKANRYSQDPPQLYEFRGKSSQPTWPTMSTGSDFQGIVSTEAGELVIQSRHTGVALEDRSYIDVQPLQEISLKVKEKTDSRPTEGGHVHSNENGIINGKSTGGGKKYLLAPHHSDTKPSSDVIDPTIATNVIPDSHKRLSSIYDDVLVVNNVHAAKKVVRMLTEQYRHLIHACDTEVAKIEVKVETPVDHGEVICFSIYSGPEADFGNGKSSIWVDVLDGGGRDILLEFAPFFEDPSIKKVWHNYSFDNHVLENYGFKLSGFHADTMHMARLWDSSRRTKGGYSLEALSGDSKVMSGVKLCSSEKELIGKISMKTIFGKKKVKKDGTDGKMVTMVPVEELQRNEHKLWVSYSALDAISTLKLYESLRSKLSQMQWKLNEVSVHGKTMFDFYEEYWRPFGEVLVKMETEGMLVDRAYLAEVEKVAKGEQEVAVNNFRNWASKYCPDAIYMNVGSDAQLRQLFFGGIQNRNNSNEYLPDERIFKIPNVHNVIEEGKKTPTKFRNIKLCKIGVELTTEMFTATGWPSMSGAALKTLAGKVSADYDFTDNDDDLLLDDDVENAVIDDVDTSAYGTAYAAFLDSGYKEEEAREACHAIAALCEVCSIDSLISNFILPLQGSNVSGKNGRVHCSLNINTETGRLSARRPNLQNQPALEKDRYKIRQAFIASPGNSLVVADYGQLELRILAHLADCKSMMEAFKAGGDFHSRTAMNMYPHIREAVENKEVILEWDPQPGEEKPPVPLLKDAFGSERRKAKMLNFSIAYGKTAVGLARDWKVSVKEAQETVNLWYKERQEVLTWQQKRKAEAIQKGCVHTLLGRARRFPSTLRATRAQKGHIERAAINTPVQGSAADVAMCAMLEITANARLKELGWKLLLQVHDEVILEGPTESAEIAKAIVVDCMSKPFKGKNFLKVDLAVDAKCAQNWYAAK